MSDASYESGEVSSMIAQRLIQEYGSWEAPKIAAAIFEETVREIEQGLGTTPAPRVLERNAEQPVTSTHTELS